MHATFRRLIHAAPFLGVILLGWPAASLSSAQGAASFRPPAVPLVTHDPYFSIWSAADRLTEADTIHWTGAPHRLTSMVRIDGQTHRVMGRELNRVPALEQKSLSVLPTRTIYTFEGGGVRLTLTFLTPLLPEDLDILSRPVTYLTYEFQATDGKSHGVAFYFDASPELAVNTPEQAVEWAAPAVVGNLFVLKAGTKDQPILATKGDDLRIDWGHLYLAAPVSQRIYAFAAGESMSRGSFAVNMPLPANMKPTWAQSARHAPVGYVASCTVESCLINVSAEPVSRWLMLAYDDEYSIRYFRSRLRPYWRRHGADAAALLQKAAADYETLVKQCSAFDEQLMADLRRAGGEKYAHVCALIYRQTFAGNKIVADANGMPLMFPKENFSNGCIGTVDVLYPLAPFFLLLSPALTKAMLVPVLDYAQSPRWPYPYAPHDLGTYPHATGQVYGMNGSDGNRMPVEESGNMLIMMAALSRIEGNADLAGKYWLLLTRWAEYLVREGLDPVNQLCTADMFGHLAHNADLSLKAILGIGGYARMAARLGKQAEAATYAAIARDYAAQWQQMAQDDGHTRLAFDQPGTWGMKHNLIWDRLLAGQEDPLFPESLGDREIAWYLKVQKPFGLPCDNRTEQSLLDWALWCSALARNEQDWNALFEPLFRYVNQTPQRVPLSDWFFTSDARRRGFQARPVVGGVFMKLLLQADAARRYAAQAAPLSGDWAPIPIPAALREVVPTARTTESRWRYTFQPPGPDWFKPGFDDSNWKDGVGGFGTAQTPGSIVGTEWNTTNIWLRRKFTLPDRKLKNPLLLIHYDEAPEVYLNGVQAAKLTGWSTHYGEADIHPSALAALRPGGNLMAVHASQTYGGQYIDVGMVEEEDPLPVRMLFDHPVRDTSICLGPDNAYYLTGTSGNRTGGPEDLNGWWYVNEGVRVWRSPDLTNWVPLGLVWSLEKDAVWAKEYKERNGQRLRSLWAPDIHYLQGNFWITYCMNYGGTGLLRSTTGKAEGPYVDVNPNGPLTGEIDASLFQDDDSSVYFVFQNGKIARMKEDLSGLAEEPRLLKPANANQVGFEGAYLVKMGGRYQLICAEFNPGIGGGRTYDCMVASADHVYGPYGGRYLAIPHAGHNMFFHDPRGQWWATFFGNDASAPWRERPGLLPIRIDGEGRVQVKQP